MLRGLSTDLSLGAQTAYAELFDQVLGQDIAMLTALSGSFQMRTLKGRDYVYFSFRDPLGKNRMAYVGPNGERVRALIARFDKTAAEQARLNLSRRAAACIALGCAPMLDKHYLVVQKLAATGFFRAGGILIGTHAFAAFGNMLGVRWASNVKTLDVDFAHAGRNLSIALPANLTLSVHDAITSLEMGLLPIRQLDGRSGAQCRNPEDPELRVDFLAPWNGNDTIAFRTPGTTRPREGRGGRVASRGGARSCFAGTPRWRQRLPMVGKAAVGRRCSGSGTLPPGPPRPGGAGTQRSDPGACLVGTAALACRHLIGRTEPGA
jgi:hypothetical protein